MRKLILLLALFLAPPVSYSEEQPPADSAEIVNAELEAISADVETIEEDILADDTDSLLLEEDAQPFLKDVFSGAG